MEQYIDHVAMTEEEALGLLPAGEYPAVFEKIEVKQAKDGKSYFVAKVNVYDPISGIQKTITQWLVFPHLLRHAYIAAGLDHEYGQPKLSTRDLESKKVIAKIRVKQGTDEYPQPKNEIQDFLAPKNNVVSDIFNDEIAF